MCALTQTSTHQQAAHRDVWYQHHADVDIFLKGVYEQFVAVTADVLKSSLVHSISGTNLQESEKLINQHQHTAATVTGAPVVRTIGNIITTKRLTVDWHCLQ